MPIVRQCFDRWAKLIKPRPRLNIWQWADSVRYLAKGVASKARHGNVRYSTSDAPHQRGIMEAFTDPTVQTTVMIGASQVMGKALALHTKILTTQGWLTMGSVTPGTLIFGSDGKPYPVTFKTPTMTGRPCFSVIVHDSEFIADADHLWSVFALDRNTSDGRAKAIKSEVVTTAQMLHRMQHGESFEIANPNPIDLPEATLPIPPYTLGAWLGDGHSYSGSITVSESDREILEHIAKDGFNIREYRDRRFPKVFQAFLRKYPAGTCQRGHDSSRFKNRHGGCQECARLSYRSKKYGAEMSEIILDFPAHLAALGLIGKKQKHIPSAYLQAGLGQRMELIRGLMDTDGHIDKNGNCEFTTTSKRLSEGFEELVATIGIRLTSEVGVATLKGRIIGPKYRIRFRTDLPVFKLARKLARLPLNLARRVTTRRIRSITSVESVPVACIQVASPDRTYLIGKCLTPTHNTEVFNNVIGYHMEYLPTNSIVMYPTIEAAERYSKKKFMPMCRATPCLDSLLPNSRSRDSGNTILVKEFTGGSVFFVGSNSPASLRGASGEILLADEIDSNEDSAGDEGDAVDLLFKRGESYPQVVQGLASTPTIEGSSRIWSWFEQSDQQFWFVPCPHCGTFGIMKWSQESAIKAGPSYFVEWPDKEPEKAVLVCATCAKSCDDPQRLEMYHAGQWRATAPFTGIRGFHLNWINCPWPAKRGYKHRLHQMAEQWEAAVKKGEQSVKVIVNTGLCETWKVKLENAPDHESLILRLETYETEIPDPVVYLTASVDTQSDRIEYEITGWGIGEECFGIKVGKLFGNPHLPDVWDQLDGILSQTFIHPCGAALRISCCLVDSGGQHDAKAFAKPVYNYVRRRQGRYIFACKGSSELGSPLVVGRMLKNGIMLQSVGGDVAKSLIYERVTIETPGPGYCHWPEGRGYDEEYFKQLTAEAVSIIKGRRMWVKRRARNEALDLRVYNHAALEIRNPNLQAISDNLRRKPEQVPEPPKEFGLTRPRPQAPARRRANFAKW